MNAKCRVNSIEELWKHNFRSVVSRSVHIIIWCKQLWVWGLHLEKILAFFSAWHAKQTVVGLSVFYSCEAERWVSPSFTATVLNTGPWCEHDLSCSSRDGKLRHISWSAGLLAFFACEAMLCSLYCYNCIFVSLFRSKLYFISISSMCKSIVLLF